MMLLTLIDPAIVRSVESLVKDSKSTVIFILTDKTDFSILHKLVNSKLIEAWFLIDKCFIWMQLQ